MLSGFSSGPLIAPSESGSFIWESLEPFLLIHPLSPQEDPPFAFTPPEPVSSNSGSDSSNASVRDKPQRSRSGSDETSHLGLTEERKLRRMLSNRESARRSRLRKQEYLGDLRTQVSRFKVGNRELVDRLQYALHQTQNFRRQNEYLRSEAVALRRRLGEVRLVLIARQIQ